MTSQLQSCLGSATGFGSAQVAVGDDRVWTMGLTPCANIQLEPGLEHRRESMGGGHLHIWHVPVTVGARWTDAINGPVACQAAWQAILDQIDKYPNLGLGAGHAVREAHVERANLKPVIIEYGNVKFAHAVLTVAIMEDVVVQEAE